MGYLYFYNNTTTFIMWRCWSGITLTEEFNRELLEAKAKAKAKELEQEGQERLD